MKYDDASWHYGGDFPTDSPEEYSGVHIALFMKWCFLKGWAGDIHVSETDTKKVIEGSLTATEFFFKYCDGKFTDEDLNEEGNVFAAQYYGDEGLYLNDFAENFGDQMYVSPESEFNYPKFSKMLDRRYKSKGLVKKPFWKL